MKLTSIFLSLVFFFSFVCAALVPATQGQIFAAPNSGGSDSGDSDKDDGGGNKDKDDGDKDKNKDNGNKDTDKKTGRIFYDYGTCVLYLNELRGNLNTDKLKENIEKKIDKRLGKELQYRDAEKTKVVLNNYAALENRIEQKADVIPDEHEEVLKQAIESDKKQLNEIKSSLKSEKDETKLKTTLCSVIYDYFRTRAYQVVYVVALDTIINASDRVEAVINSDLNQVPESEMAEQMKQIITEAAKPVEKGEAQAVELRDQLLALGSKTGSDKGVKKTIDALDSSQVKDIVNSIKESVVRFDGIRAAVAIAKGQDPEIENSEVKGIWITLKDDKGAHVKTDSSKVSQIEIYLKIIDKKTGENKILTKKLKKVKKELKETKKELEDAKNQPTEVVYVPDGSSSTPAPSTTTPSTGGTTAPSSGGGGGSSGGGSGGGSGGSSGCEGITPTACTGGYGSGGGSEACTAFNNYCGQGACYGEPDLCKDD